MCPAFPPAGPTAAAEFERHADDMPATEEWFERLHHLDQQLAVCRG